MESTLKSRTFWIAVSICIVALAGCSIPERGPAVPLVDTGRALPLGIPNARFFADDGAKGMTEEAMSAYQRELATLRAAGQSTTRLPPVNYLAMSGGGDNGAYGAGLLNGWTESGRRPEFKLVTGVSTGALIAPFAFLGPEYDAALKEVYTSLTPEQVYRARRITAALFDDAMADTSPLAEVIARHADQKMFDAIAREYRRGRLLLIGTANIDAQRPVIWNIGALAASGHPQSLDLFRKILRASAAIPGVFQPMLFDVELDGRKYQELHVDGGVIAQLFLYPAAVRVDESGIRRERHAYVVRNGRLDPEYASTDRRTIDIAGRAIITMLSSSGQNDVLRTYFISQRDGVDYNLTFIGRDFVYPNKTGEFDQAFMRALYAYGYEQGKSGRAWYKAPPGLDVAAQ